MMVSDLTDDEYRERVMATFIYRHPERDGKRRNRRDLVTALGLLAVVGVYFAFVVLVPMLTISGQTVAGIGPKNVWGYVYDGAGTKADGVIVTVTIEDSVGTPRAVKTNTSGWPIAGFYGVTFNGTDWFIGDTIRVSADLGPETNSSLISGSESQQIDLHLTSVIIPEFGFGVTVITAVLVLAVTISTARHRGRKRI